MIVNDEGMSLSLSNLVFDDNDIVSKGSNFYLECDDLTKRMLIIRFMEVIRNILRMMLIYSFS
jgi:hypothetical protein